MKSIAIDNILTLFLFSILFFSCKNSKINNTPITPPTINISEYNIHCNNDELKAMFRDYKSNEYIPVTIEKNNTKRTAQMRVRGDSSRDYDKKSLKVKILDSLSIDTKMIFNFNAEYSDKSFLRSFLSSTIFKKLNSLIFQHKYKKMTLQRC